MMMATRWWWWLIACIQKMITKEAHHPSFSFSAWIWGCGVPPDWPGVSLQPLIIILLHLDLFCLFVYSIKLFILKYACVKNSQEKNLIKLYTCGILGIKTIQHDFLTFLVLKKKKIIIYHKEICRWCEFVSKLYRRGPICP